MMSEKTESTINELEKIKPEGNMVKCRVWDSQKNKDIALWGNSGFMGEPYSFFEPHGNTFKASEIMYWEYIDDEEHEYILLNEDYTFFEKFTAEYNGDARIILRNKTRETGLKLILVRKMN